MTTQGIIIRALEPTDIDLLYKWENSPEIQAVGESALPLSKSSLKKIIQESQLDLYSTKQARLGIADMSNNNLLGTIDLFDLDMRHRRAGVGIMVSSDFRKAHIATNALLLFIDYCKDTLNLHQLYCNIKASNIASLRLFKKVGFVIVGEKKDWFFQNEKWESEYLLQKILVD